MEEKQKIDVAVFRYSVIQDFISGIMLNHGEREHLLREKCARKWLIPHSCKTSISRGTIQRWICLYQSKGGQLGNRDLIPINFEGFFPSQFQDK